MAISTFKECSRPPLGKREDGSLHGPRVFEVRSTDHTTTLTQILAHASCPAQTSQHPDEPAALLRTYDVEAVEGFDDLHLLTCQYDSQNQPEEDDTPEEALIRAGFRAQDRQVPAFFDGFGRPNVNTAGDLIDGLVRVTNEYVIPVTAKLRTIPLYLFTLNNTINSGDLVFRGITFPAGTLLLKNMVAPDSPERDSNGGEYWPLTFDIIHNPDGFYELHPNKGKHELVYQTRTSSSAEFQDDTYSNYDSKTPTTDRRIIKRRIETDEQQNIAGDIWLDRRGRAVKTVTLTTTAIAPTGAMNAGGAVVTLSSSYLDTSTEDLHTGASIAVVGAGPHGRTLVTRIASVASATQATLDDSAATNVTTAQVYLPGIICRRVLNYRVADWSPVPLPNNDPV